MSTNATVSPMKFNDALFNLLNTIRNAILLEIKNTSLMLPPMQLKTLKIIDQLENKIKKTVLSSNQTLIWDSIRSVGYKSTIKGYGKLLKN